MTPPPELTIDFETYSEAGYGLRDGKWQAPEGFPQGKAGLPSIGAPRYAAHPTTEVLCLSYGPKLWTPGDPPPQALFDYIKSGGLIHAHNSSFEFYIWHYVCHSRMGWPPLLLAQMRCDMARGNAYGLPGKLEKAAEVLGAPEQKDKGGALLIRKLCMPQNNMPAKTIGLFEGGTAAPAWRRTPADSPELFKKLGEYCVQDVRAEEAVAALVPELSPEELELWLLDQRINVKGAYVDPDGLANCLYIVKQTRLKYAQELIDIVGIPDITVDKLQQLRGWLAARGLRMDSMDADTVAAAVKRTDLQPEARRVLEIRQLLGSASVKKTYAIDRTVSSDGRLRSLFVYYGARNTGRFAGMGAQPQNLPNSGPAWTVCGTCNSFQIEGDLCRVCGSELPPSREWDITAVSKALDLIATRDLASIETLFDDALAVVAACLRGLFCAAPGHDLICSDYAAIEAVVLAMIAGEQWRIDVFRTHGQIYEMSASKITGVPFEDFARYKEQNGSHHPMRKKIGKVAELASGYQGSVGAWKAFGADEFMNDDEILQNVRAWRKASPMIAGDRDLGIKGLWQSLEDCAVAAIQSPGECFQYRGIMYGVKDDILYCRLLSGRALTYHKPRLHNDTTPWGRSVLKITFEGWNSDSTKGPVGWMRRDTYGGKLTENVVQATARDILTHAMVSIDKAGYPIVLHVHDEIVSEVVKDFGSVEEFESIMSSLPPWCVDWPVKASGGWRGERYRK